MLNNILRQHYIIKKRKKTHGILSALLPNFVIPRSFSTLYKCSLTTVAQHKPYHEILLIRDCYKHKGSWTVPYSDQFQPSQLGLAPQVSTRYTERVALSYLSKAISSTLNFRESIILTGLKLAIAFTQSKCCIY